MSNSQAWLLDGGGEVQEGGGICVHMADSLPCTAETNTALESNCMPIFKKQVLFPIFKKIKQAHTHNFSA